MAALPEHIQLARATIEHLVNTTAKVRAIDALGLPLSHRDVSQVVGVSRARVSQILQGRAEVLRQRVYKRRRRRAAGVPEYSCTTCGERGHNAATCGDDEGAATTAPTPELAAPA